MENLPVMHVNSYSLFNITPYSRYPKSDRLILVHTVSHHFKNLRKFHT